MKILFLTLFSCISIFHSSTCVNESLNDRPIIGIVSQEDFTDPKKSYIAASYVKFVEGSGARVVPIMINQTDEYYEHIVNSVNGILLPGGATYFNVSGGFADTGIKLYKLAIQKNEAGDYFPVWGTCLGFELLTYAAANEVEHRMRCDHYNVAVPLEFEIINMFRSRMFGNMPYDLLGIFVKENVTANFHRFCLTEKNMTELGLDKDWLIISTNRDSDGLKYISTIEHRKYPIYGVQFHPEKNNYEWKVGKNHPHSAEGVRVSQYLANFFVNEARKNHHQFATEEDEKKHLIYNYPVTNTSKKSLFMQVYVFTQ